VPPHDIVAAMPPVILRLGAELRDAARSARGRGDGVGFVPTMGALHRGHISLVEDARRRAGLVVVSIFVNPTQFGPTEDLARYPRDLQGDVEKLAAAGVDFVFAPSAAEMYPAGDQTRVRVGALAEPLCGRFRPGHFEGVATVVAKLLNLVGPCVAVFGRKDYQQWLIVRRMAADLLLPVEVVARPTLREPDGLAMSSRNAYLSPTDRENALTIVRGLDAAARAYASGERDARALEGIARDLVEPSVTSIDYVEVRDADTLDALSGTIPPRAVLAVACRVGGTRLIDNLVLGEEPPPLGYR
jgi:pantoate--beta-alanine ligase